MKSLQAMAILWLIFLFTTETTVFAERKTVTSLQSTDSITSCDITWKLAVPAPVGQFVNGDYYVVGPVVIQSITPAAINHRNGSVLNLALNAGKSGFDQRVSSNRYDSTMRALPPIAMKPGDALISSVSVDSVGKTFRWLREGEEKTISPVKSVAVLTCLDKAASPDAFRPSYCDRSQHIYYANNLQWNLLPKLQKVTTVPNIDEFADHFSRPWLDVCFFGFDAPIGYQPDYGREIGRAVGMASLLLMLDFNDQQKRSLCINLVQYGIDLWGIARAGYTGWPAHGGHGSGRKWPIIFAGVMLGDTAMRVPTVTLPDLRFGEDMQTMHATCWTGATAVYGGHQGVFNGLAVSSDPAWGPYEHLRPAAWPGDIGESYRRCSTSLCWIGQALAALLMHAKPYWRHDAFFDYCDRWMTEEDSAHVRIIQEETGEDYSAAWARQKQCWDTFVEQMWEKYRGSVVGINPSISLKYSGGNDIFRFDIGRNSATISFILDEPSYVNLEIYNATGKRLRTLSRALNTMGKHTIIWDIQDTYGHYVSNGLYWCIGTIGSKRIYKTFMYIR